MALVILLSAVALIGTPPARTVLERYVREVRHIIAQPEAVVFVPQVQPIAVATQTSVKSEIKIVATPTLIATRVISAETIPILTNTPSSTPIPQPTQTAAPTPTSIPTAYQISGIEYQDQHGLWNYCGPSNLAMLVSFWGEPTDRLDTGGFMRGGVERYDDKNVSPDEMVHYVETQTEFEALYRVGGTINLLKGLISAEIPVIVETGYAPDDPTDWMGHYLLLNGYDDATQQFTSQDTYKGSDELYTYDALNEAWRAFNYTFLIAYPAEREQEVLALLGDLQDESAAATVALKAASVQAQTLTGQQQYFAQLNIVDSYVALGDYAEATAALDASFATYADLSREERPWRTLWYRFEPFEAYFMVGRYQDVVNLADATLNNMAEPILEEVFYWRALAYYELGQEALALKDMTMVNSLNNGFKDVQLILTNWQK